MPNGCCNNGGYGSSHYYCDPPNQWNFPSAASVRQPGGSCGYGGCENAPCGPGQPGPCGTCCWDSTLCYPVKKVCAPGDRSVTINLPATAPNLSDGVGAVMAVYNYSVQNVIARTLKFVASYYDWIWCQTIMRPTSDEEGTYTGVINCAGGAQDCNTISTTCGGIDNKFRNLPPASLWTQFAQVVNFALTVTAQSNLSQCLCSNLCGILQILVGLDSNKGIRDFVLNHAFGGDGSTKQREAGCGRLYDEESYSKSIGGTITSTVDLIIEVAKSLDAVDDPERAEALLGKICRCLISAAASGEGCCTEGAEDTTLSGYDTQYQAQFYAMVVDWIQFIHFDRDCRKFAEDKCECCPAPPSVEQWLEKRCKLGTGDGQCVVCTGACKKYRRSDDFKPMLSSLLAIKHTVALLTATRDGDYQNTVSKIYRDIVSDFSALYGSGQVTFFPDCAAPQFCCSSDLNSNSTLSQPPCKNICTATPIPVRPVPEMDIRRVYQYCGNLGGIDNSTETSCDQVLGCYTPNVCGVLLSAEDTNTESSQYGQLVPAQQDANPGQLCLTANPCVVIPKPSPVVDCGDSCCHYDSNWD